MNAHQQRASVKFSDFIISGNAGEPHYMVIGHPIGHSLSPQMHRLAIERHKLPGNYLAIDLSPEEIGQFVSWMNRDEFLGANVTIPYKREFLTVVDRLDSSAQSVGALNTLVKTSGELIGYNTDIYGFQMPLEPFHAEIEGETAILFGTGGASRAVLEVFRRLGVARVILVSRNPGNIEPIEPEGDSQEFLQILCSYQNWQAYAEEAVLLVNSTPLGMAPRVDRSPVEDREVHLLKDKICYDLVYNPLQTLFLTQAASNGARTISGLKMFIGQGKRAFELWTGKEFPEEDVASMLKSELE